LITRALSSVSRARARASARLSLRARSGVATNARLSCSIRKSTTGGIGRTFTWMT